MRTEDFIYKNIAKLLSENYPKCRIGLIATAASQGKKRYIRGGDFKGKAFDICYKEAEKNLKQSIKHKL